MLLFAVNVEYVVCLPVIDRVWSERVERQPAYGVKVISPFDMQSNPGYLE